MPQESDCSPAAAFVRRSGPFLEYVFQWAERLHACSLSHFIGDSSAEVALCAVDLVDGFCHHGHLASDRVAATLPAIAALFNLANGAGIDHFLLLHDAHDPAAREFRAFPIHCVQGTSEAKIVGALSALPFAHKFTLLQKNSISSAIGTGLQEWLLAHPTVRRFVCVGDVTDMCLYQLATHLDLWANAHNLDWQVVVPADCVQTYHLSQEDAARHGALPHEGDLFHLIFLYHMALNGVTVVKRLCP